ncbi:MAG: VIT domain-containing protein [Planctomycetota bacterium]
MCPLLAAVASLAAPAAAQGIVLERVIIDPIRRPPTPPPRRPIPIQLREHRVRISVDEQVATTEVVQVFSNPNRWPMEGVYVFPLPEGAAVSRFSLFMGDKEITGEILSAAKAREIYRSIVRRRRDPGLLEYMGRGLLRASIFPIPPRGGTKITLRYGQLLRQEGGLVEMSYPLKSDRFSGSPVAVSGAIEVRARAGVANLFSPTHELDVVRKSDTHVKASFEERASRADRDLKLLYTMQRKDVAMTVVTHKPAGEDGYFLLLVSPRTEIRESDVLPKDVVFVFDTSGSMAGQKMEQARGALRYALKRLRPEDRFNLITFATEARPFREALLRATEENVAAALAHVGELAATGGTAIHDALAAALALPRTEGRVPLVIFLTDGRPTVGPTDIRGILDHARKTNRAGARVFAFGVGDDVNTHLLGDLASHHGGTTHYVKESEDIEVKVSLLVDQVAAPVLTGLTLAWRDLGVYDVHPRRLGDLFKGQQLAVVGRYKQAGDRVLRLTGRIGTREVTHTFEGTFGGGKGEVFLPRLWAVRRVGFLLAQISAHGEKKELVDEVRRLGLRHGIVTPYTSFLVVEDERMLARRSVRSGPPETDAFGVPGTPAAGGGRRFRGADADGAADAEETLRRIGDALAKGKKEGKDAVDTARLVQRYAGATRAGAHVGRGVKLVAGKTFRLDNGVWVDLDLPEGYEARRVVYLSDEYFELLQDDRLARYLSVGDRVRVLHGGVVYEVVSE